MTLMHRIWLGGEMPERYQEYGELWQDLNLGNRLHDWTEEEIWDTKWINQSVLNHMYRQFKQPGADKVAFYTHVADVVDYELCYTYGGWYFNTDLKPVKSLIHLEPFTVFGSRAGFAMEDDIHPVNMAMYSPKGHQIFADIIGLLPMRYFGMPGAFMNATTGVQLIEQALSQYRGLDTDIEFWNREVFNPIHWSEFDYGADAPVDREFGPETVAVHEWLHRTNQRGQRILET